MTIAQTIGPEGMMQHLNADEFIKRLAAAQGIDVLNLVKSMDQQQQEKQQNMQQQEQMELTKQAAALESTPMNDPSKNPSLAAELEQQQPPIE
jgi:23S rRNA pseudoU1915 N3-methylase RlmH